MPPISPTPARPFVIDDRTPIAARLAWLEHLIYEARALPQLARLASLAHEYAGEDAPLAARATAALRFAQRAGYISDPPGEWMQPLAWTILHGGDCEDLSALFVALARRLGLRARLAWIDQPQNQFNHVTAQVWLDGSWRWAEASVCGARVGETPLDAARRLNAWYIFRPGAGYVACPPPDRSS